MRYHNITKDDMLNGDGLRVVLWVSGCGHACKGCHNPITWNSEDGLLFDESAKREIYAELAHDYVSGLTFSGGDPLYPANAAEVAVFAKEVKEQFPDKTIWLYTGYTWDELQNMGQLYSEILNYVDVLVDGRFELDKKDNNLHWKGSSNQRVIDVKETVNKGEIVYHGN